MARHPVTPDDLRKAAALAREALVKISGDEWDTMPPHMTWTRRTTAIHSVSAVHMYATQLASGIREGVPRFRPDPESVETASLPGLVASTAAILARVAEASPPETRGFHPAGSPDPEGFLAMGCAEILLHAWDSASQTSSTITPPDSLAQRIVDRLFPWSSTGAPGWQALLFETGRAELPGHESPRDGWMWHNAPLSEWDGKIRRSDTWKGR